LFECNIKVAHQECWVTRVSMVYQELSQFFDLFIPNASVLALQMRHEAVDFQFTDFDSSVKRAFRCKAVALGAFRKQIG